MGKNDAAHSGEHAPGAYPIHDRRPVGYIGRGRRNAPSNQNVNRSSQDNNNNNNNIPPELRDVTSTTANDTARPNDNHIPPELRMATQPPTADSIESQTATRTDDGPSPQRPRSIESRVLEHLQAERQSSDPVPAAFESMPQNEAWEGQNGQISGPFTKKEEEKLPQTSSGSSRRPYLMLALVIGGGIVVGVVAAVTTIVLLSSPADPIPTPIENPGSITPVTTVKPTSTPTIKPTSAPSQAPTEPLSRMDILRTALLPLSGDSLTDPTTAHSRALSWLAIQDFFFREDWKDGPIPDGIMPILVERYVMAVLYFATGGPMSWTGDHTFLDGRESVCTWADRCACDADPGIFVITCDGPGGRIDGLFTDRFGLRGSLPAEIGLLTHLTQLIIARNPGLEGNLPDLSGLTELYKLNFYANDLSGSLPTTLGLLTSLRFIDVSHNRLSGTIPTELGRLTLLQELFLEYNRFDGYVPASFRSLEALSTAWFNDNNLVGDLSVFCDNPYSALVSLSADCNEVQCDCCTRCCLFFGSCP